MALQQVFSPCKVKFRYAKVPELKVPKDELCNGDFYVARYGFAFLNLKMDKLSHFCELMHHLEIDFLIFVFSYKIL